MVGGWGWTGWSDLHVLNLICHNFKVVVNACVDSFLSQEFACVSNFSVFLLLCFVDLFRLLSVRALNHRSELQVSWVVWILGDRVAEELIHRT